MNDKDKEAFEKWAWGKEFPDGIPENVEFEPHQILKETWQAACEYKQREITLLENEISYLEETIADFMDEPDIEIKRLQSENEKLNEKVQRTKLFLKERLSYADEDKDELFVNKYCLIAFLEELEKE